MRKLEVICFMLLATSALAQNGGYLFINNNIYPANTVDFDTVTSDGKIRRVKTEPTGGEGFPDMPPFAGLAAAKRGKCFFAADSESSDIASFQLPSFNKLLVNFSSPLLGGTEYGVGLAPTPNGRFLVSAWAGSGSLAVLATKTDCSLSLVGSPISQPDLVDKVTVSADGKIVVVGYPFLGGAQAYSLSKMGTLAPLGPALYFGKVIPGCAPNGCLPGGQDATNDGKYWVWGVTNSNTAEIVTAILSPNGFQDARLVKLPSSLQNTWDVRFSPAAREGQGNLYVASVGDGSNIPGGIVVTRFNHGSIHYAGSYVNTASSDAGTIQTVGTESTGSPIMQGWSDGTNSYIQSYTVHGTKLKSADRLQTSGGFPFLARTGK